MEFPLLVPLPAHFEKENMDDDWRLDLMDECDSIDVDVDVSLDDDG